MQSPFDTFAKGILEAALSDACEVSIQHPVVLDALYPDALVEPRAHAAGLLRDRGMLGRMAEGGCVVDPFAGTPGGAEVHRCVARVSMLRVARADPLPLWIISQGVPRGVVAEWALAQGDAWGAGVFVGASTHAPRVVALTRLPRTRDTLLLRMMGHGAILDGALTDYRDLPDDAWERGFVPRLLLQVRNELRRMGANVPADQELRMRYAEIVAHTDTLIEGYRAEGRAEGQAQGHAQGRAESLREAVLAMCEVLAVPLDDARRASLATADADALSAMLDALRRTRALP